MLFLVSIRVRNCVRNGGLFRKLLTLSADKIGPYCPARLFSARAKSYELPVQSPSRRDVLTNLMRILWTSVQTAQKYDDKCCHKDANLKELRNARSANPNQKYRCRNDVLTTGYLSADASNSMTWIRKLDVAQHNKGIRTMDRPFLLTSPRCDHGHAGKKAGRRHAQAPRSESTEKFCL